MATELAKAYVQIVPSAQGIQGAISDVMNGEAGSAGEKSGKSLASSLGGALKKGIIGLGVGKVLADSIGNASEFETAMAKVSTLYSGDNFSGLESDILKLSGAYGMSASMLAEAAYSAESAGVEAGDLSAMLEGAARLSVAGFTDVDTALSATAKTMNAYGDAAGSIDEIQKVLIQTQNLGITTVGELGQSLANVTPTAAAMGVGFDQVGASLAQLTAAGVPTAQATTQLRSAMTELGKSGTKADKAFRAAAKGTKYAGMSFQDAMANGANLGDVFGMMQTYADKSGKSMVDLWGSVEAGNAAMLIASDVETFDKNLAAMGTDADVVGEAYGKMSDTFGTSMNKLKESAKNFMTTLFEGGDISASFDNMLGSVGDLGKKLVKWLTNGLKTLGKNLPKMMNSLLDFAGSLLDSLKDVDWIELGTTIITGIIGALGSLGSRLAELIGGAISSIVNGDVDFGQIGGAILDGLGSILGSIGDVAKSIFDTISNVLCPDGENFLGKIFSDGEKEIQHIDWKKLGENVLSAASSLVNLTGEALAGAFTAGYALISTIDWETLGTTIGNIANGLVNLTGGVLAAGLTAAESIIHTIDWAGLGETVGTVANNLIELSGDTLAGAFTAAETLISGIDWVGLGSTVASVANGLIDLTGETLAGAFSAAESLISQIDWAGLGTTCASAANELISLTGETLSGAFTAAHSIIDTIDWEGLGTTIGGIANALIGATGETLAAPFKAAHGILLGINWEEVGSKIQSGLGDVWGGITGFLGGALGGAGDLLEGVGSGAGTAAEALGQKIAEWISGSDMKTAAEDLKKAMEDLKTALNNGKTDVEDTAKKIGEGIYKGIAENISSDKMNPVGASAISGISGGFATETPNLSTKVTELCNAVKTAVEIYDFAPAGETIVSDLITGMANKIEPFKTGCTALMDTGIAEMKTKDWSSVGTNIVTGIIQGINGASFWLMASLTALAQKALAAAKAALGIKSPSKVMRDQVGRWIPAGIAEGIERYGSVVDGAMDGLAADVSGLRVQNMLLRHGRLAYAGGGAAAAGNGYNQTINVYSPEALTPSEIARQTRIQTQNMVLALRGV